MLKHICYLCGGESHRERPGRVRDNSDLRVLECDSCGLVFLSSFEHIRTDHYQNSGMHSGAMTAIEAWLREAEPDDERRLTFLKGALTGASILDFGCGAGGFMLKAKEVALSVVGVEPESRLAAHFDQHQISVFPSLDSVKLAGLRFNLISAFHVFEHLSDPRTVLSELAELLDVGGQVIIEVPSSADILLTLFDCTPFREFTYWSQHLFLFNASTLAKLVRQSGLELIWIKQIQRYPLSNHLHWLSQGKPGGHRVWQFLDSPLLQGAYEAQLAAIGATDTLMAGIRVR